MIRAAERCSENQGDDIEGEQPVASFKTFRDSATFTTKWLILRDAQRLIEKKIEIHSLP
jgi:hypothetical protein